WAFGQTPRKMVSGLGRTVRQVADSGRTRGPLSVVPGDTSLPPFIQVLENDARKSVAPVRMTKPRIPARLSACLRHCGADRIAAALPRGDSESWTITFS